MLFVGQFGFQNNIVLVKDTFLIVVKDIQGEKVIISDKPSEEWQQPQPASPSPASP